MFFCSIPYDEKQKSQCLEKSATGFISRVVYVPSGKETVMQSFLTIRCKHASWTWCSFSPLRTWKTWEKKNNPNNKQSPSNSPSKIHTSASEWMKPRSKQMINVQKPASEKYKRFFLVRSRTNESTRRDYKGISSNDQDLQIKWGRIQHFFEKLDWFKNWLKKNRVSIGMKRIVSE